VVTAPFLQAAHAQPLALLQPRCDSVWHAAAKAGPGAAEPAGPSAIDGIDAGVYAVLLQLVQQSAAVSVSKADAAPAISRLPPHITSQVLACPELHNMARVLAYHRASAATLPLGKAGRAELARAADDLAATLSCMLDSW